MSDQETQVVEQTEEQKAQSELAYKVAKRTIEMRNDMDTKTAMLQAAKMGQDIAKEFDITVPEFAVLYDKGIRESYDELSTISKLPLSAVFHVFAKNRRGEEKGVGYVKGNSYENALDIYFKSAEPFFFDKEDCRLEVVTSAKELKELNNRH